jgi:hypothetical protein
MLYPLGDVSNGMVLVSSPSSIRNNLIALANWTFLDAAILSAHAKSLWGSPSDSEAPVHVTFVDWILGICSLLGYLIINLIDKDRVRGNEGFGDSRAVWRARALPAVWYVC